RDDPTVCGDCDALPGFDSADVPTEIVFQLTNAGGRHLHNIATYGHIGKCEIRWADLNRARGHEQASRRPVLILSHDVFNQRSGTVIAVALTSQMPCAGFLLTLGSKAARLTKRSWITISQIRTLSADRIGHRIARAAEEEVARAVDGLNEIIG